MNSCRCKSWSSLHFSTRFSGIRKVSFRSDCKSHKRHKIATRSLQDPSDQPRKPVAKAAAKSKESKESKESKASKASEAPVPGVAKKILEKSAESGEAVASAETTAE